jgi:UDP-2,4-diacetamido-2,4,6-trideoxy-beta-L-altropyranose hydrolase
MKLIVRADASTEIGTGHVMRCLALAQCWQKQGGTVIFIMSNSTPALDVRLKSEGVEIIDLAATSGSLEDAQETVIFAQKFNIDWIVIDGYQFQQDYQKIFKNYHLKTLFIDDYGHSNYYCSDIVLNQNINADQSLYQNRETYTKLLLGSSYTLLRQEFRKLPLQTKTISLIGTKILVTLGGGDPDNVTLKVIQALSDIKVNDLEVLVVIGASNPSYNQLNLFVQSLNFSIKLVQNVTDMPQLMAWADISIAAGGSTNWELAFMGLPSVIIVIANNQQKIAEKLHKQGIIINLGWHQQIIPEQIGLTVQALISDRARREIMSQKGQQLIDGKGAIRVVSEMVNMLT